MEETFIVYYDQRKTILKICILILRADVQHFHSLDFFEENCSKKYAYFDVVIWMKI